MHLFSQFLQRSYFYKISVDFSKFAYNFFRISFNLLQGNRWLIRLNGTLWVRSWSPYPGVLREGSRSWGGGVNSIFAFLSFLSPFPISFSPFISPTIQKVLSVSHQKRLETWTFLDLWLTLRWFWETYYQGSSKNNVFFLNEKKKLFKKNNPDYGTDMKTWEYRT